MPSEIPVHQELFTSLTEHRQSCDSVLFGLAKEFAEKARIISSITQSKEPDETSLSENIRRMDQVLSDLIYTFDKPFPDSCVYMLFSIAKNTAREIRRVIRQTNGIHQFHRENLRAYADNLSGKSSLMLRRFTFPPAHDTNP